MFVSYREHESQRRVRNPPKRRTQDERARTTLAALLNAAERLFGRIGYDRTSLDDIAVRAGLTKGALYHHFPNGKAAIFESVVLRLQYRMSGAMDQAALDQSGPGALRNVLGAYFSIACSPDFHRITLLDAPLVLGPQRWREIEGRHALRHIRAAVDLTLGHTPARDAANRMLAATFFGAAYEATFAVMNAPDAAAARRQAVDAMCAVIEGGLTHSLRRTPGG
jgi:AcrR family transcriptional regulator